MKFLNQLAKLRHFSASKCRPLGQLASCQENYQLRKQKFQLSVPVFNEKYLLDKNNIEKVKENINLRKGVGDIDLVHEIIEKLGNKSIDEKSKLDLELKLQEELRKIPNQTHPEVISYGDEPKIVKYYNEKPQFKHSPLEFSEICKKINILRTEYLSNFAGHRSYYLMADLAEMEQALVRFAIAEISQHGFTLISVPDILPAEVIKSCGFETEGERNQVYKILPTNMCLSGTSEMALAGYFAGYQLNNSSNPIKVTAVSRCFRAETSSMHDEKGIYRVHQFTKAEMFSVCQPSQSESVLNEFRDIEISIFNKLGLHFKLLDMPPNELASSAYRKYDIEAWMPGRNMWGEISSCSNCTDYQSRRLNIKFNDEYAHTVNGTAMAIPRMLIAIIETFQKEDGTITIPKVLQKYMRKEKIRKQKILPELKLVKNISSPKS